MNKFSRIRNVLFLLSCLACIASGVAAAQAIDDCTATGIVSANAQGLVETATGEVTAKIGSGPACPLSEGQTIVNDTIITTGAKSTVTLRFADGQGFSLPENSSFHVVHYFFDEQDIAKSSAEFKLLKGGLRAVTGLIGKKNKEAFKLDAGGIPIEIRGAAFAPVQLVIGVDSSYHPR